MGYFRRNNPRELSAGDTEFGGPALGMPQGRGDAAAEARAMRRAGIASKNDPRFDPAPPSYGS